MDKHELAVRLLIMGISSVFVLASMGAIALKDKSWINWSTMSLAWILATNFVFPLVYTLVFGSTGSTFAFCYYYSTYAAMASSTAFAYCLLKPLRLRRVTAVRLGGAPILPWVLLCAGILLYLPVLFAFREFLTQPRQIYANFSAGGYGVPFYLSTTLAELGVITYLFKEKKSLLGASLFGALTIGLLYMHGTKGQMPIVLFMAVLHGVYVKRRQLSLWMAAGVLCGVTVSVGALFFFFGNATDLQELVLDIAGYSDYARNAMLVIDDQASPLYWGQLEFEEQFYTRVPRALWSGKPRDIADFRLAKHYFPAVYRTSSGVPAFDIGLPYADMGYATIFVLTGFAALTGWAARSLVVSMKSDATVGRFLLLLFFGGVTVFSLGGGYLLPETALAAFVLNLLYQYPIRLLRPARPLR